MIDSLLIANRGEIARRIMRTARRLGVRTVAVYSEADRDMPFVREADQSVCIGAAPARESYLRQDRILDAAKRAGASAIHPGYGFLSENADFAQAVIDAGLIWVGAPPAAIWAMGLKDAAKERMIAADVPVTPGYLGQDQDSGRLQSEAEVVGYPILIKAVAGGGGKGMRRVNSPAEFDAALQACKREAASSFGDDRVLLEKYVLSPRHIEVQIFGDSYGNVIHLYERDCSLQRRHQKVIEEAPAPEMDGETRRAVCEAAVKAAKAVGYVGAGTVEFIADASDGLRADRIWFMEMNTRLQVEHPVTEAITGQDLVEWQIKVASGEALPLTQDELPMTGFAIEARLYAENPTKDFLPSIGRLEHLRLPNTVRIDSGVEEGGEITSHYDPMIAKLISHGSSRREAAQKLAEAVAAVEVWPVKTNAAFLMRALQHPGFLSSEIDTGFIERHAAALIPSDEPSEAVLKAAAAAVISRDKSDPWSALTGLRLNAEPQRRVAVQVGSSVHQLELDGESASGTVADGVVFIEGGAWSFGVPRADSAAKAGQAVDGAVMAPMPGTVIAVHVAEGDHVTRGQPLLVLEAMKMEQVMLAPFEGTVRDLKAATGAQVVEGSLLVRVQRDH
jgi:3-methylcrotonyl-CoA carboxylase alpha subunit